MGNSKSKQPPPPEPVVTEFDKPWRDTPWEEKERLENHLRDFQLCKSDVKYIRILLIGPAGAGKSSFVNSVMNAFRGRVTTDALANTTKNMSGSFTKTYKTYDIRTGETVLPFVLTDTMGLEEKDLHGIHLDDITNSLKGFVKEGHKFNPTSAVSDEDEGHRSNPSIHEKALCLVYVMPADKLSFMSELLIKKLNDVRQKASEIGIPQAIILTRVDELCPLVHEELRKVYTSKKIKDKLYEVSDLVGVPVSHTFPVKNYHDEIDPHNDIDVLILRAFTHLVEISNDKLVKLDAKT